MNLTNERNQILIQEGNDMRIELKNRIVSANKIYKDLERKGYLIRWNEKTKQTEIYIPGGVYRTSQTVGYITKKNEVVMF